MTKAQAIHQSILVISEHFQIDPKALADRRTTRGVRMRAAMASLIFHMRACGYSYAALERFFAKGNDAIRKLESQGRLMMRGEHKAMIESLPKIPTTLVLTTI